MAEISEDLKRLWRDRDNAVKAEPASIVLDTPEDEPVLEVLEDSPLPAVHHVLPSTTIQQNTPVVSNIKLHAVQNVGLEQLDFSSYVWRR
jgi:hypothetical protein